MAVEKRKFYNSGDAKGFTKAIYFETVRDIVAGEDVDQDLINLVADATAYELEGIALKATKESTGERKDPLQSEYAHALRAAIKPFLDKTPRTAKQLIEMATAKNRLSPKGTPFAEPWVARVLNVEDGVTHEKKIVETVNKAGLKAQREVTAYTAD